MADTLTVKSVYSRSRHGIETRTPCTLEASQKPGCINNKIGSSFLSKIGTKYVFIDVHNLGINKFLLVLLLNCNEEAGEAVYEVQKFRIAPQNPVYFVRELTQLDPFWLADHNLLFTNHETIKVCCWIHLAAPSSCSYDIFSRWCRPLNNRTFPMSFGTSQPTYIQLFQEMVTSSALSVRSNVIDCKTGE